MRNKIVFITGAAGGIGLETGKAFLRAGATVILSDYDKSKVLKAVQLLESEPGTVSGIHCDVSVEEELQAAIQQVIKSYGRLDILVNNAGLQFVSPIEDLPAAKFQQLLSVMLLAPFIAIKNVFPSMKKQGWGRIINMASINGLVGFSGKAAYNSAKHGLIGLTKVAALEAAGFNITVNAVCPGYVNTELVQNQLKDIARMRNISVERVMEDVLYPLIPQRRLLEPDEVSNYILFLAGEKAAGITGQSLVIDGGYTIQ